MNEAIAVALITGALGLAAILAAVSIAYNLGRRAGTGFKSSRFERLVCDLDLHDSTWQVKFEDTDAHGNSDIRRAVLRFRQVGSRIVAEGEGELGQRWSAEGVIFRNKLCYLYLDRARKGHVLGSVMVQADLLGLEMSGMRTSWSVDRNAVLIQTIQLSRVSDPRIGAAQEEESPQDAVETALSPVNV